VDSTRCISHATIELRDDELPLDPAGWVYGCDICQDVCPWNRFRVESPEVRFQPRAGLVEPRLDELAAMTQEEFSSRFRRSPIKRTKLRGMARNARAVAARAGDEDAGRGRG
jgi:epoxyqueuosine reductase